MKFKVTKLANELVVRISPEAASRLSLEDGSEVEINRTSDQFTYKIDDLLRGMTPAALRGVFEWGPDQGREHAP